MAEYIRKRQLMRMYNRLGKRDQDRLFSFARFMCQRQGKIKKRQSEMRRAISRPKYQSRSETAINLRQGNSMLDISTLLSEASELISQHVMEGRDVNEVIDELEMLFQNHYQNYESD